MIESQVVAHYKVQMECRFSPQTRCLILKSIYNCLFNCHNLVKPKSTKGGMLISNKKHCQTQGSLRQHKKFFFYCATLSLAWSRRWGSPLFIIIPICFDCCHLCCLHMTQMILPLSNIDFWFGISLSMSFKVMGHNWVLSNICWTWCR